MTNANQVGTYTLGTFGAKDPTKPQQQAMLAEAQTISASDFNLVMLASMHVHKDGSLWFNDTLMIHSNPPAPGGQLSPNLAQCIATMKKKAGGNGKVLASFGGGGDFNGNAVGYWDFLGIQNLIAQYPNPANNPFFQNLKCMFDTYPGIDGLDLDLESYTGYSQFTPTVVTIIEWLVTNGHIVTLCPYDTPDFWCDVVKQTSSSGGKPAVAWVNLQNADETLQSFVDPLGKVGIGLGNIVGGLQTDGMSAAEVTGVFSGIESQYAGIGGGWLWNLEDFGTSNTAAYASAVAAGLGSTAIRKAG
jgi:hypothetical protein